MDNEELKAKLSGIMPLNYGYFGWKTFSRLLEENGGELTIKFTLDDGWRALVEKQ